MKTLTRAEFLARRKVPFHFCAMLRRANRCGQKRMTRRVADGPDATPKARAGDLLYSHEPVQFDDVTFHVPTATHTGLFHYRDDNIRRRAEIPKRVKVPFTGQPWRGRTLPWEWAREFYEVLEVRCEPLQAISEEDAKAEGASNWIPCGAYTGLRMRVYSGASCQDTFKAGFALLWDSLNARRGLGWDTNPRVFVYSYQPVKIES